MPRHNRQYVLSLIAGVIVAAAMMFTSLAHALGHIQAF